MVKTLSAIAVVLAVTVSSLFINPAHAQDQSVPTEEYLKWRKAIPDYDKRLYDRVLTLNARMVRVQKITIIGFVVTFLFIGGGIVVFILKQGSGAPLKTFRSEWTSRKILKKQRALMKILSEIKTAQNLMRSEADSYAMLIQESEIQLRELREQIESEDNSPPTV